MQKIIPVIFFLIFSNSVFSDGLDDAVKAQCKYDAYGNGKNDFMFNMFLLGWVQSALYHAPPKETKTNANPKEIVSSACQRALNDTKAKDFYGKFSWEAYQVIRGK